MVFAASAASGIGAAKGTPMKTAHQAQSAATPSAADLDRMVGPDPLRPGPAHWRLLAEQVPVRAIIGQIAAEGGTTEPDAISPEVVASVARGYDISVDAVRAAIRYYARNRCFIDDWLMANGAVVNEAWLKANDAAGS